MHRVHYNASKHDNDTPVALRQHRCALAPANEQLQAIAVFLAAVACDREQQYRSALTRILRETINVASHEIFRDANISVVSEGVALP